MAKRMKTDPVIVLAVVVVCLLFAPDGFAFRCGDEIVGTGDSKAKVLIKCGKPTHQEKVGVKKGAHTVDRKHAAEGKRVTHDARPPKAKGVEKWTYNCGRDDFIYVLTFEGGVVTHIDTDGRGRGASECLGR